MEQEHQLCPLCNTEVIINDYIFHIITSHTATVLSMLTFYIPEIDSEYFIYIINNYIDSYTSNNNYDYLLQLCDNLGYSKRGINDITTITHNIDVLPHPSERCPICLETFIEKENICSTNRCNHLYCKPCLKTWLIHNLSCPICQRTLDTE